MDETLFKILLGLISLLSVVITSVVVPYIKTKIDENKLNNIVKWIAYAVKYAEMIYKESGRGEEKKQYVFDFISNKLNTKGIKITDEQLNVLIEAVVKEIKTSK